MHTAVPMLAIGIDMVGVQAPGSRGRGIGRYVADLAPAVIASGAAGRVVLYFHDDLPLDPEWRETGVEMRPCGPLGQRRERLERVTRDNPEALDALIITSPLLEAQGEPSSGPPAADGRRLALATIVYDLIPLVFRERYLSDRRRALDYDERLRLVSEYDALLTVSRATREDVVTLLGVDRDRVFAIGAAADENRFSPGRDDSLDPTLSALGVRPPFVLSVAGMDERKNVARLIEAVGRTSTPVPLQLVLSHDVTAPERDHLFALASKHGMADRLVVTGRVSDVVLRELYRRCGVFALASRYEGFGLPLLEAMLCGAPVIAGHNSSQPEVVGDAGYLVEPDDVEGMARILTRVTQDGEERDRIATRGLLQATSFRWQHCAQRCMDALQRVVPRRRRSPSPAARRLRVAVFTPLPPEASGVADHAADLLARIQDSFEVDAFHSARSRPWITQAWPGVGVYDERLFDVLDRAHRYDALWHEMGNSFYHDFVYRAVLRHGGLVFLHELNLAGLHVGLASENSVDPGYLLQEIQFDQPHRWRDLAEGLPSFATEPGGVGSALGRRGAYLARRLARSAGRVLVSNALTLQTLRDLYPEIAERSGTVPLGTRASPLEPGERRAVRARHRLPAEAFVFGIFGIVSSSKLHIEVLEAFGDLAREDPSVTLLVVGRGPDMADMNARAQQIGVAKRVQYVLDPQLARFRELAGAVDVGINVRRAPTNWEFSASLLDLLAAGTPTIISAVDAFRTVPRTAAEWIEEEGQPLGQALKGAMLRLRRSEGRRLELREGALDLVAREHDWSRVVPLCEGHLREAVALGIGRRDSWAC